MWLQGCFNRKIVLTQHPIMNFKEKYNEAVVSVQEADKAEIKNSRKGWSGNRR